MPGAKADALGGDARIAGAGREYCDVQAYGLFHSHSHSTAQAIFAVPKRLQPAQG